MPSECEHLQTLIRHHEHEHARAYIYETLAENGHQPDCFFYNARLFLKHQLAVQGDHARPTYDSLMRLYDQWFSVSRAPNMVLNWKGRDIRDFYIKKPDSLRKYCAMYKRIYDADKESMHPYNIKVLAFCACDLHGKIDVDSLWNFTRHQAQSHHEAVWKASYKSLKRELIACPRISCDKLHSLLHPVLSSGKEGSEETHQISTLLAKRGCKGSSDGTVIGLPEPETSLGKQSAAFSENKAVKEAVPEKKEALQPETPAPPVSSADPIPEPEVVTAYDALFKIAEKLTTEKKYTEALYGYEAALKSATTPIEKADSYMGMAIAADSLKDYAAAKKYAQTVHSLLPDELDGMKFLSKLYQKGEDRCGFHSPKELAAFYILLSNISWNLGNSEEADGWRENANLHELYKSGTAQKGEKVKIGCFINEEVELP